MRRFLIYALALCALWARPARSVPTAPAGKGQPARAAKPPASRPASSKPADKADPLRRQRLKVRRIAEINRELFRLFKAGKYRQCEPLLRRILEIDPDNSTAWYNLACYHSRVGERDRAVECLNTAVKHGYSGFGHLQRDPDLDAIRKTDGYRKLLARKDEIHRRRAEKVRDQLREKFGRDYLYEIDHDRKVVFATNVDRQTLDEMKRRLTAYAGAQWKHLFTHPFDQYLTVVIPRSRDWRWAQLGGFYSRGPHVLYARTVGLTLVHEFTHALHGADQDGLGQRHPIWVTEGLATLFESSKIIDGRAVPQPNRRLNILQRIVRRKRSIPFEKFIRADHGKFMRKAVTSYCQGRYMMMYLHAKGLLKKWYDAYTDGYEDDPTGGKALEKVLGRKLAQSEEDWKKWVLKLEPPILHLPPKHAYIGIQLRPAVDGVRVMRVVPGSGAHQAGLKADDVIVRIDDERTIDPAHLMEIVNTHAVGDKLQVRFRRDGKYRTVTVTLGAMPERPARSRPTPAPKSRPKPKPPKPATHPATKPATKKAA